MNLSLNQRRYHLIKFAIWVSYIIFIIFCLFKVQKNEILGGLFLSGLLIQLTIIRFVKNWYYIGRPKLLDWFRLATFYALIFDYFALVFVLDRQNDIVVNNRVSVFSEYSLSALLVILIGLIGLKVGEILISNTKPLVNKGDNTYDFIIKNLPLFYLAGFSIVIVQIYLVASGQIGYGSGSEILLSSYSFVVRIVLIAIDFFLIVLAIKLFKSDRFKVTYRIMFFLLLLTQIVYGFMSGMKENIIVPLLIVISVYIIFFKKLPITVLASSLIFLIILYPINDTYREVINNTNLEGIGAVQVSLVTTLDKDFGSLIASGSERYVNRVSLFGSLMYSIQEEDNWNEYKNLNRYIYLPVSWIVPRGLMPNKPTSTTGASLYEMQTGRRSNSITPSTFGWSYFEGGYIQVFITFLMFGFVVAFIGKNISLNSFFGILLYIFLLANLIKVETDIYFRISDFFQTIFIYFLLYITFIRPK